MLTSMEAQRRRDGLTRPYLALAAWVALAARNAGMLETTGRAGACATVVEVEAHAARCGPLAKGHWCLWRHLATDGGTVNSSHRQVPVDQVPRQLWRHGTDAAEALVVETPGNAAMSPM